MTFGSVALWRRWCSGRRRPRPPARLGDLTAFGAAPRSPPVPSGPSGALHTSGAYCAHVLSWPRHRPRAPQPVPTGAHRHRNLAPTGTPSLAPSPQAQPLTSLIPEPTPNFARNSPTTASSFEFRSLGLQRFWALLKLQPIELRASFLEATPYCHPRAPQPDPPPVPRTPSPRSPRSCAHTQFRT